MLRRTPVLAVLLSLAITFIGIAPSQATPPDVTDITVSNATIYPAINTASRPGTTTITAETSVSSTTVDALEIRTSGGALVKRFPISGDPSVQWDGLNDSNGPAPAGTYTIFALNGIEDASTTGTVTVSRQYLKRLIFKKTGAAARNAFKYVGKCSTLRKPSKRGWAGSVGFYSNTKCKTQTWNASAAIAGYVTRLPAAERYVDLHIDTYGGASKAKPRSRGAIEYFNLDSGWVAGKFAGSKVGWHNGLTRSTSGLVDNGNFIAWRFATAFKSQYDVKQFRVVVRYDVLSAS